MRRTKMRDEMVVFMYEYDGMSVMQSARKGGET